MENNQESSPVIVRRNRTADDLDRSEAEKSLEVVQRTNTNDVLAGQFPEWDLTPPSQLIRRRSSKLL